MQLSCVVILYNPSEANIEGIKSYINLVDYMIIVDNSDNGTDYHQNFENISNLELIKLSHNMGLGYALNVGCKRAISKGFKYAITMDQDSKLLKDGFKGYTETILNRSDVAVLSPQYIIDRKKPIKLKDEINSVLWTMQSACIFNLQILSQLGFFREDFFVDVIDYEFCLRANKNNYSVLKNYNYAIKHSPAITKYTKVIKIGYGYCSPLRIYYQSRNLRAITQQYKHLKIKILLLIKFLKIILLFNNKKEFLKMWKKGKIDFKNNKFGKYVG